VKLFLEKFENGQEMEISIKKKFKKRTSGQPGEFTNFNGYYWAVIVRKLADELGYEDDNDVHNLLQMKFNKRMVDIIDEDKKKKFTDALRPLIGQTLTEEIVDQLSKIFGSGKIEIPAGTSELSGGEFADYCSRIRTWANIPGNLTEHGIYLPEPYEIDIEEK